MRYSAVVFLNCVPASDIIVDIDGGAAVFTLLYAPLAPEIVVTASAIIVEIDGAAALWTVRYSAVVFDIIIAASASNVQIEGVLLDRLSENWRWC